MTLSDDYTSKEIDLKFFDIPHYKIIKYPKIEMRVSPVLSVFERRTFPEKCEPSTLYNFETVTARLPISRELEQTDEGDGLKLEWFDELPEKRRIFAISTIIAISLIAVLSLLFFTFNRFKAKY